MVLASAAEPLPEPTSAPATDEPANASEIDIDLGPAACGNAACGGTPAGCPGRELVDVHLATPYGVSSHLLVPVSRRSDPSDGCAVAFEGGSALRLTFTASKAAGTRTPAARIDEFFASEGDPIAIGVPDAFVPPPKASLRLLVRDDVEGVTAAEFSFDVPAFDARRSRYVIAGGDLRNFVGDTSRPATDKTLRGGLKPYLDHLLAGGSLADDGESRPFTLSAALVAGQQEIPVGGSIAVTATRRGKTLAEPAPNDPAVGSGTPPQ